MRHDSGPSITVRALGGQVLRLGRGLGSLNVLDLGALDEAADALDAAGLAKDAAALRKQAHGRRASMVEALPTLVRGARSSDTERTVGKTPGQRLSVPSRSTWTNSAKPTEARPAPASAPGSAPVSGPVGRTAAAPACPGRCAGRSGGRWTALAARADSTLVWALTGGLTALLTVPLVVLAVVLAA